MKELIERLRRTIPVPVTIGNGVIAPKRVSIAAVDYHLANPDGPQAADLIAAQREALEAIARGRYDGLEVSHLSAKECRAIARKALGRGEG